MLFFIFGGIIIADMGWLFYNIIKKTSNINSESLASVFIILFLAGAFGSTSYLGGSIYIDNYDTWVEQKEICSSSIARLEEEIQDIDAKIEAVSLNMTLSKQETFDKIKELQEQKEKLEESKTIYEQKLSEVEGKDLSPKRLKITKFLTIFW